MNLRPLLLFAFVFVCVFPASEAATTAFDDSGGLTAIVVLADGHGEVCVDVGLKNKTRRSITFMYCGATNYKLEMRTADGRPVGLTKEGKRWEASFAPTFFSRRAVLHRKIRPGKTEWIFHGVELKRLFKLSKREKYKVRAIFEDRFPSTAGSKWKVWNGRTVSDWVFFALPR